MYALDFMISFAAFLLAYAVLDCVVPYTLPSFPRLRFNRVGGLLHWRFGRIGGSFYLARRERA